MKNLLFALLTAACSLASALSQAETLVYPAITDFPVLTAGEVDYEIETAKRRDYLSINAGKEENRNKFARATRQFDGPAGVYDVTIAAVGEIDGEGEYHFLVNGTIVGSATNSRVEEDWGIQNHTFNNITIPANAELGVESNAVTNGLIPEGDITAYARGRWRTLTLVSQEIFELPTVDLAVSALSSNPAPVAGQSIEITVATANNSASDTATSPVVTVTLSGNLQFEAHELCKHDGNVSTCQLPEIAASDNENTIINVIATATGSASISVSATADQPDNNTANNTGNVAFETQPAFVPDNTVDLAVQLQTTTEPVTTGDEIEFVLTATNKHAGNTATEPVAGILLPAQLVYSGSGDCTQNGQTVLCNLPELAPAQSTTVRFSVTVNGIGESLVVASASSAESEDIVFDNEVVVRLTVDESGSVNTDPSEPVSNPGTPGDEPSTGGGTVAIFHLAGLLLISGFASFCRRRQSPLLHTKSNKALI